MKEHTHTQSAGPLGWHTLSARRRGLAAWLALGGFGVFLAYYLAAYSYGLGWVEPHDFIHFFKAGEAARLGDDIYLSHTRGYIYPPLFALVMLPLSALGYSAAAVVWTLINGLLLVGGVWLISRETIERFRLGRPGLPDALLTWTIASTGTLAIADKARAVLQNGQSDALTMFLVALAFRGERGRPFWCGVCLGLACNIKYHTLVFLVYFLVRRRWAEAGGMLLGIAAGALAGVPVWGWACNNDYLRRALGAMVDMTRTRGDFGPDVAIHSITWPHSISITSGLARMIDQIDHPGVFLAACVGVAGACFVLGWWMLRRRGFAMFVGRCGGAERGAADPSRAQLVALEWAGLLTATAIFSPQSTGRHLFLMVFPAIVAAPAIFFPRAGAPRWPIVAAWCLMFMGMIWPPAAPPFEDAIRWWRHISGMSWCTLVYYFVVLAVMLRWVRAGEVHGSEATGAVSSA